MDSSRASGSNSSKRSPSCTPVLTATRAFRRDSESDLPRLLAVVTALRGVELEPLRATVAALNAAVSVASLQARGLSGPALGKALQQARIRYLDEA